ncbi:DUF547 domain-containing protein [Congregibacter variabilis]|uniref:DUF547 domain-containing protein n=1 Tax=Congregibacter variabilis TaxID=3081200 RepID=A0ABZ0I392_9GAMM|nr:DUF547 domain-containing protein [Congregibacter sp. IMCC43200]
MRKSKHRKSRTTLFAQGNSQFPRAGHVALLASLLLFGFSSFTGAQSTPFSHDNWDALVKTCVVPTVDRHSTAAEYDCFAERRDLLNTYLNDLSGVSEAMHLGESSDQQLAFLINAYNAWTVALILDNWPDLESIRDLGSILRSPWKKPFIPLFGDTVSLDDIEHGMIREPGRFDDPRIHFAVNCASIGCPALRQEAYEGERIELQLEEQTRRFLADPSRNRFTGENLEISSIFKWYRDDFERGWRDNHSLHHFLSRYSDSLKLTDKQTSILRKGDMNLKFLDYDWRLNQSP